MERGIRIEPTSELIEFFLRIYACSMPKLGAAGTKTDQLEFVNLLDFRGFRRVLLYRVSAGIAFITPSTRLPGGPRSAVCNNF
jgi:hypothetical protein